ncbi:hypothetical protein ACV7JQ_09085 [Globicatella sulfidifaciens]
MLDKVKVGGVSYLVEVTEDLSGKTGNWGEIEYKTTTIRIDDRLNQQIKEQTVIHEIVHAMFRESCIEQDEQAVDIFGKLLYQVLKDNDFSWLRNNSYKEIKTENGTVKIPIVDGE